jgi:hypothetical protein
VNAVSVNQHLSEIKSAGVITLIGELAKLLYPSLGRSLAINYILIYNLIMPELSRFLGIVIAMYFHDHNPPHFHVLYNEYDAEIEIKNLTILEGKLPARVLGLAMEWAELHKEEVMNNWNLLQAGEKYNKIQPLV